MPRLSREDYMSVLERLIPGDDEESLTLIGNMVDTYDGTQPQPSEDWEGKYNELRRQYRERFFNGGNPGDDGIVQPPAPEADPTPIVDTPPESMTEEDIFNKYMPPVEDENN